MLQYKTKIALSSSIGEAEQRSLGATMMFAALALTEATFSKTAIVLMLQVHRCEACCW